MPFRATELSARIAALAGLALLSGALAGCRPNETAAPTRHSDPAEPVPGIVATPADRIPPGALVCLPKPAGSGEATVAAVSDQAAPRITISVPQGWTATPGTGATALTLIGPDTMSAQVTIDATDLAPESAFLRHTAGVGGTMPRLKFSVTGAPFCGFSSQQLTGTLQGPSGGIDFADRITHIWTNTTKYLVTIHLEGHSGAGGFGAAKSALLQDFAVVIP